jgi:hypothetical protein
MVSAVVTSETYPLQPIDGIEILRSLTMRAAALQTQVCVELSRSVKSHWIKSATASDTVWLGVDWQANQSIRSQECRAGQGHYSHVDVQTAATDTAE